MKTIILLCAVLFAGCAYNSQTITAGNEAFITCNGTVDKPVDVGTTLQGNVPINGGTVTNPAQNIK